MNLTGQLITLDRTLPLVRIGGEDRRAEYAASFSRDQIRVTVGDFLQLSQTDSDAAPQIVGVLPRTTLLARRICREHPSIGSGAFEEHLLAANFDRVFVVCALGRNSVDLDYIERQLVAAYEGGGQVTVVLNKTDLARQPVNELVEQVSALAEDLQVVACSAETGEGIEDLRALCPPGSMNVFFGRSGVGKSTLINALIGSEVLATGAIRERDHAGRHTTVARQMVFADDRSYFDTPGVRSIGNYLHEVGLEEVFTDVIELAGQCRFRDCKHEIEPGCAVRQAIEKETLTERRLQSYQALAAEVTGDDQLP
ncbi:MAG: ribosome small subunit-dependent GTPase A [Coriobacteriia bacterium]|nr:ribosome small subunit-dependent GTPase A [Coriobacteriia bacterium]